MRASSCRKGDGKVLFVIDTLEVGGAERSIIELAISLGRERAVVCQLYEGNALADELREHDIPHVHLNLKGRYSWIAGVRRFRRVLRAHKPAVVHSTLFRADIISRVSTLFSKYPLVCSLVNDPYSKHRWRKLNLFAKIKLAVVLIADYVTASLPDRYISNSKSIAASNEQWLGISRSKISVIYRGRDLAKFARPARAMRARMRADFGLSDKVFLWIIACRLVPRKSVDTLLRAAKIAKEMCPDREFMLWVLGDGSFEKDLHHLCEQMSLNNDVVFLGKVGNVDEYLMVADGALSASLYEGLPGALIEAMAAELPLVVSDIPMHRELSHGGEIGYFFQIEDPEACAKSMSIIMNDLAKARKFGKSARALAKIKFDINTIVDDYLQVYEMLSKNHSK